MKIRSVVPVSFAFALPLLACRDAEAPPAVPAPTTATPPAPPQPIAVVTAADAKAPEASKLVEAKPAMAPSTPANELTMGMFRALHAEKGNVFFSGTSLRTALAMTALGAKGPTLDEMAKVLNVESDPAKNVAAAKADADAWKAAAGKAELVVANRLFVDKAYALDKTFLARTESGYGAGAVELDFVKSPEDSRGKINGWVSETTKGKIKDLLPGGSITTSTRLVLTNAIYFKGNWANAFDKRLTKDEPFHTDAGSVMTPMMHREGDLAYAEDADVKLVAIPYKDSSLEMLVVLPKNADGLSAIESGITGGQLDAWAKNAHPMKVTLSMPRFTFSWGRSVKPELEGLGIRQAFSDSADFSAMAGPKAERLGISDVIHKAFILVDETGTEAAAATGVAMRSMALARPVEMKLDRPFLFFVRNAKTGDVLFAGRFAIPAKKI